MSQRQVVFVLGRPGAGKSTQCANVARAFPSWAHLSAGALLREEAASGGSELARQIRRSNEEGRLSPSHVTVGLLLRAMAAHPPQTRFVIDGFPASGENLAEWERAGAGEVLFCLYYDCPLPALERRLLARAATSGRLDDNPETIRKRLAGYDAGAVLRHFAARGRLHEVSADGPAAEVWAVTAGLFRALF